MRNDRDTSVIERMIKYCEDVEVLLERFDRSFDNYTNDISFQYSCNMCIIQIGELVGRLSEEFIDTTWKNWQHHSQMLSFEYKRGATGSNDP